MIENWRHVWRYGIAPSLTDEQLALLEDALENDDPRLIQGATTEPPAFKGTRGDPLRAACAVAFGAFAKPGTALKEDAEELFSRVTQECEDRLGERAASRFFTNWWDDTPRDYAVTELLGELRTYREKETPDAA